MKRCDECGKSEALAEILETVDNSKFRLLCYSCAIRNEAVILTKPSQESIDNVNSKENMYNRLRKEAGLSPVVTKVTGQQVLPLSPSAKQIYPESNIRRAWKTIEEKDFEKDTERREKELEEIRKKKAELEERENEIKELEKEGKINFKSRVLTIFDLKKLREKRRKEQEKKNKENKEVIETENAIIEIMENPAENEKVIRDHNEF